MNVKFLNVEYSDYLIIFQKKTKKNKHDWTPQNICIFCITMEHKYTCKILFIMFLLKSFIVKCLELFLTPIPLNKIVSALK